MIPHKELCGFAEGCRSNSEGDHFSELVDALLLASRCYRRIRVVPDGDTYLAFSFDDECVPLELPLAQTRLRSLIARMANVLSLHVRSETQLLGDTVEANIPTSNGSVASVRVAYNNRGGDYFLIVDQITDDIQGHTTA